MGVMKSPEEAAATASALQSPTLLARTSQAGPAVATSTHPKRKRSRAKQLARKILGGICVMPPIKQDSAVAAPTTPPPTLLARRQRECPASFIDCAQLEKNTSSTPKLSTDKARVNEELSEMAAWDVADSEGLLNHPEVGNLLGDSCQPISNSRNIPWDDVEAERDWCTQERTLIKKNWSRSDTGEPRGDTGTQDVSSKDILERIGVLNKLGATVMIPASAFPERVPGASNGAPLEFRPSATHGMHPIAPLEGEDAFSFSSTLVRHVQQCAGVRHV